MFRTPKPPVISSRVRPLDTAPTQLVALSDTRIASARSDIGELNEYDLETKEVKVHEFNFPHARKSKLTHLANDQFAVVSAGGVSVYCSKTRALKKTIALPLPEHKDASHTQVVAIDIDQAKVSLDGSLLLVNLNEDFDVNGSFGPVRHSRRFVYIIDLATDAVLRIPVDRNVVDASFVSGSRVAVALAEAQGVKHYDFDVTSNSFHESVSAPVFAGQSVENLWVWPQRPSMWLVSQLNNDHYDLNLYSVEEKDGSYQRAHIKKVGEIGHADLDHCVMGCNSLVFPDVHRRVMEFSLSTMQTVELTEPGIRLMRPACVFPGFQIGMLGEDAEHKPCIVVSQLKSVRDYEVECQAQLTAVLDSALIQGGITMKPFQLLGIAAQYAVSTPGYQFFSASLGSASGVASSSAASSAADAAGSSADVVSADADADATATTRARVGMSTCT